MKVGNNLKEIFMKNTIKFLLGIAFITVIIFSMAACDDGGGGGGGGGGGDPALNGTWVDDDDGEEVILNNGSFEAPEIGKGRYTTSGNNITMTMTHVHGDAVGGGMLESKWYTKAEIKPIMIQLYTLFNDGSMTDAEINAMVDEMLSEAFAPHTGTYSVSGNTLTMTMEIDGETETSTYTRKSGSSGGGGTLNTDLNGTWVDEDDGELILNNGSFEVLEQRKGTYTTNGNKITITITHVYNYGVDLEPRWYTKAEMKTIYKQNYGGELSDAQIDFYLNQMFASQTGTYSLNGNTFSLTMNGETITFIRKGSNTGPGTENNPFPLALGTWTDGTINRGSIYYSFTVTSGNTYYVWWNDSFSGNDTKTADIIVNAYYSNGSSIFEDGDSAWDNPQSFTASSNGTVKLKVRKWGNDSGTFAIAYSTSDTRPGSSSGGGTPNTDLNGTWVDDGEEMILNNGSFEVSGTAKGSYTTNGNQITITITQIHGSVIGPLDLTEWYTKTEIKPVLKQYYTSTVGGSMTDAEINVLVDQMVDEMFAPHIGTYSISGDKLTMTMDGETSTYTRQGTGGGGTPSNTIDLTSNSWYSNNISYGGTHTYRFYANSGTTYKIEWEDLDNSDDYDADVYIGIKQEGSSSYSVDITDDSPISFSPSTSGYYIIEVIYYTNDGPYRIRYY
jgi:hypothetical protein